MKIVFILGALEPGENGVGDYTRRLSGEMIRQGHEVNIVALNDPRVKYPRDDIQKDGNQEIPVLRLPAAHPWNGRIQEAKTWIDNFNPEWQSLQFVNFSFHRKGLLPGLTSYLEKLGKGRKWHIMFHELWVVQQQLKYKLLGSLQQQQIKKMITRLNPVIIHTQSAIYQNQLKRLGFKAGYLPIFSNIPVMAPNPEAIRKSGSNELSLIIFGSIYPNGLVETFAKELAEFGKTHSLDIRLKLVGRSGKEKENWERVFRSYGLMVKVMGERSTEEVSGILTESQIGISTTPAHFAEKSGSVAAMLAHGLKVLIVSESKSAYDINHNHFPEGIYEYSQGCFDSFYFKKNRTVSVNGVNVAATKMILDLGLSMQRPAVVSSI